MLWLIIGIVVGLILIVVGLVYAADGDHSIGIGLNVFGVIVLIGGVLLGCIKYVPTGSTGIVTCFGKVEDQTLQAGIVWMAPWKSVITMDNRTQKQSLDLSCFSSDIQEVTVTYTLNYRINQQNAQEIYKTIGENYFDTIVQPKAIEAVKAIFAKYNAEALIDNRAALSKEIEMTVKDALMPYNVEIESTSIENIDFTDSFTNAVEAKQVAEQNKLKAQTEQEQATLEAEAEAERQKIKADADAQAAIIAAQADAEIAAISADSAEYQGQKQSAIMDKIGESLSKYPQLIEYYRNEKWDGSMPDTLFTDGETDFLLSVD